VHLVYCGPFEPDQILNRADFPDLPKGYGGYGNNRLIQKLAEAEEQVTAISTSPYIDSEWQLTVGNLTLHLVPNRSRVLHRARDFFAVEKKLLRNAIRQANGDLIHAHWSYEFAQAALRVNRSSLITIHDAPITILRTHRQVYRIFRLLMAIQVRSRMQNVTFVSPYLRDRWRKEMLWFKNSEIITNLAPPRGPMRKNSEVSPLQVLASGDDSRRKNMSTLLAAWPSVKSQHPNATLHLTGAGLFRGSDLFEMAERNGLNDGIAWHGFLSRPELFKLLKSTELLVHPSLEESTGLVLLEAMSLGVPTLVGKNSGAASWTVGDGGATVDVSDPVSLAAAISELLADKDKLALIGKEGFDRARTEFDEDAIVSAYRKRYRDIFLRNGKS
jgi:glycosyltransferase involved in cell wall biosynthesis